MSLPAISRRGRTMQTTRRGDGEIFLRGKMYAVRYYVNGRRKMVSARTSKLGKAQTFLRKLLKDKDDGNSTTLNGARLRISDGLARVVTDYKNNDLKSVANVERRIKKHLTPFFGNRRMVTIASADIERFKEERRAAGATNAEINRELAIVRRAFRLAKLPHPVTMLKEAAARSGFFAPDQFAAVCAHLSPALVDVVTFAYITGWRVRSEVLPLEWRHVDFDAREVRLDAGKTKNGEPRVFPFTASLAELLESRKAIKDELARNGEIVRHVFHRNGKPIRAFYTAWRNACRAAGVPGRLVHDFRRTAVRNLDRAGVSRKVAMEMVGHKTQSIYDRYRIITNSDLHDAAGKLDALDSLTTGSKTGSIGKSEESTSVRQSA
jgi:integrase